MASRFFRWFYGLPSDTARFPIILLMLIIGWILEAYCGKGIAAGYLLCLLALDCRHHQQKRKPEDQ